MYILIINNDKEEINEIQNVIGNVFENQACIIANSDIEAREIIDEKQISLAFIKVVSKKDFDLAQKIIKKNPVVNIICISDTKDFAYDAFLIHASGYIVKPVKKGDPKALQSFNGEYMTQYSDWSGTMELNLQKYFYEE